VAKQRTSNAKMLGDGPTKPCSRCGGNGPFYPNNTAKGTWQSQCQECRKERQKAESKVLDEYGLSASRRYFLKRKYGLTSVDAMVILASQGFMCPVCETDLEPGGSWHVDHDHRCCDTGNNGTTCGQCVRGILCGPCNLGLGAFRDSQASLARASAYLGGER
jgi:hypothetical protein